MAAAAYKADSRILGVILAGGQSRRMGGGDKSLTDLGGQPLLAHVIARFAPQVATLILNANGDPQRFAAFNLPVVPDLDGRADGPLAGVLAAMDWAARSASGVDAIATVTSDVPFLPLDLVPRLRSALPLGPAVAVSAERRHPSIALWPMAFRDRIADALERDERGLNDFAVRNNAVEVSFALSEADGQMIDPFFNVNAPSDLAEARAILARSHVSSPPTQ